MDIIEALDGPHEWGYRCVAGGGFVHDPAPNNAAREIQKLRSELDAVMHDLARYIGIASAEAAEAERLREFIWTLDGKTVCIRGDGDTFIDDGIIVASDIVGAHT